MCFRRDLAAAVFAVLAGVAAAGLPVGARASPDAALDLRIERSLRELRNDPNLGRSVRQRSLRWVNDETSEQSPTPAALTAWTRWFDILADIARLAVWVLGTVGLGFAAVWSYGYFRARRRDAISSPFEASHRVGELDIRPDSLPQNIGAAAQGLWTAGEERAALSLLYRGALSRLVHRFSVRIGRSSTEAECVAAVNGGADPVSAEYFRKLVMVWQRAVYGGEPPDDAAVLSLCEAFARTLDASR